MTDNLIDNFFKEPLNKELLLKAREDSIWSRSCIIFLKACAEYPPYNHLVDTNGNILDTNGRMLSKTNPEEYETIIDLAKQQARKESSLFKEVLS